MSIPGAKNSRSQPPKAKTSPESQAGHRRPSGVEVVEQVVEVRAHAVVNRILGVTFIKNRFRGSEKSPRGKTSPESPEGDRPPSRVEVVEQVVVVPVHEVVNKIAEVPFAER